MAKNTNTEQSYSTDLHIRLKADERDELQKRADESGLTLSQAARSIIFQGIKENENLPPELTPKLIEFRKLQALQSFKTLFKKLNLDISKIGAAFEKTLSAQERTGKGASQAKMILVIASETVAKLLKIQEGLNEVIRIEGGTPIHIAAKPGVSTAIGSYMSGVAGQAASTSPSTTATAGSPAPAEPIVKGIPYEFRHMATLNFDGVLLQDVEIFNDGKYDKIRLQLKVEMYRGGQMKSHKIDAIDFASRYKNAMSYLKKDTVIVISGDFDFSVGDYNGVHSDADATVEIKTWSISQRTLHVSTMEAQLLSDAEQYNDGRYDRIRLQIKVERYRNGQVQSDKYDAIDFASRYKNVMPYLKKDRFVLISGEFDHSAGVYNGVPSDAVGTIEIKTLTLPNKA